MISAWTSHLLAAAVPLVLHLVPIGLIAHAWTWIMCWHVITVVQSTHDTLAEADEQAVQNTVEGACRGYSPFAIWASSCRSGSASLCTLEAWLWWRMMKKKTVDLVTGDDDDNASDWIWKGGMVVTRYSLNSCLPNTNTKFSTSRHSCAESQKL